MSVMEKKLSATVQQPAMKQYTGGITELYHFALTQSFVAVTQLYEKNGTLRVEVIDCPNSSACSVTFTSRLSYIASLSTSTTIQIGCSSGVINGTTCSPEEPLGSDSVTLPVRNCTGIYIYVR